MNNALRWTKQFFGLTLGTLVFLTGCGSRGPQMFPVSGTVTLDGKPVAGASVMFSPETNGTPAAGTTDEQGYFTLRTVNRDGVSPGKHKVTVTLVKTTGFTADKDGLSGPIAPGGVKEEWIVPKRYSNPDESGLTAEVVKGMAPVKLELKSP
jgi:predicted small lipoprotein YifL